MKTFNVGIIGFGFIGKVHAYAHLNLPFFYDPPPCRTRITHVCTSRPETAEKAKLSLGAEVATTDSRKVTEDPDVDIVHICTPNDLHRDELLSAMERRRHIYCDKPLVASADEAADIERALADYSGIAQMTFQNRFFPATMRAKQLIDDGFVGRVLSFRARYLHSGSADPTAPMRWKLSAARGGGVIADLGSHVLDLMHWLLGDFEALSAASSIAYPERPSAQRPGTAESVEAEDAVFATVRTRAGALGQIEASKIATGTEDELAFEIHGSKGALRFNGTRPHFLEAYDQTAPSAPIGGRRGWTSIDAGQRYPPPAAPFPGPKLSIGWIRTHVACLANFLQCVADGSPAEPSLAQGIYVQRLVEACRTSARSGEWVRV